MQMFREKEDEDQKGYVFVYRYSKGKFQVWETALQLQRSWCDHFPKQDKLLLPTLRKNRLENSLGL
jgi:hypothetical protein